MISAYAEIYENILIMDEAFTKFYSLMWGEFYVIKRPCHLSTMVLLLIDCNNHFMNFHFIFLFLFYVVHIIFFKKKERRGVIQ